jgi:uncharacterized membrane protein YeaQ/YmgE (transglycosylase-associated protein family)
LLWVVGTAELVTGLQANVPVGALQAGATLAEWAAEPDIESFTTLLPVEVGALVLLFTANAQFAAELPVVDSDIFLHG